MIENLSSDPMAILSQVTTTMDHADKRIFLPGIREKLNIPFPVIPSTYVSGT